MPSTPPRGDEQDQIPEQIIVGNQEQPLGDPSPGIPEPSQTPRQTPQVYIAGEYVGGYNELLEFLNKPIEQGDDDECRACEG